MADPKKRPPDDWQDVPLDGSVPPGAAPAPDAPGRLEALGRGGGQGITLGWQDEANAGIQSYDDSLRRSFGMLTGDEPVRDFDLGEQMRFLADRYRMHRDADRTKNTAAAAEHPGYYGTANALAAAPTVIAGSALGLGGPAIGATMGLGSSDAELTPDKTNLKEMGKAALATGAGAAFGKLAQEVPVSAPVLGGAAAAFGDRIGMTPADRVTSGVGAALAAAGLIGKGVSSARQGLSDYFGGQSKEATEQALTAPREKLATADRQVGRAQDRLDSAELRKEDAVIRKYARFKAEQEAEQAAKNSGMMKSIESEGKASQDDIVARSTDEAAARKQALAAEDEANKNFAQAVVKADRGGQPMPGGADGEALTPEQIQGKEAQLMGAMAERLHKNSSWDLLSPEEKAGALKFMQSYKDRVPVDKPQDWVNSELAKWVAAQGGGSPGSPGEPVTDPKFYSPDYFLPHETDKTVISPLPEGFSETPPDQWLGEFVPGFRKAQLAAQFGLDPNSAPGGVIEPGANLQRLPGGSPYVPEKAVGADPGGGTVGLRRPQQPPAGVPAVMPETAEVLPHEFQQGQTLEADPGSIRHVRNIDRAKEHLDFMQSKQAAAAAAATPEAVMARGEDTRLRPDTGKVNAAWNTAKGVVSTGTLKGGMQQAVRGMYADPAARAYVFNKISSVLKTDPARAAKYSDFLNAAVSSTAPVAAARIQYLLQKDPELASKVTEPDDWQDVP